MMRRVSCQYANTRRPHWRAQDRAELAVENRERLGVMDGDSGEGGLQ